MAVKFKRPWNRYEAGDVATFTKDFEKKLIEKGTAEAVKEEPKEQKEEVMQPTNRQTTTSDRRTPNPTNRQTTTGGKPKGK